MYEVKGFIFKDNERLPMGSGLLAHGYDEVFEVMEALGHEHYMFLLNPIKVEEGVASNVCLCAG